MTTIEDRIRNKIKASASCSDPGCECGVDFDGVSPGDLASDLVTLIEWGLRSGADGLAVLPQIRMAEVAKIIQERRLTIMAERRGGK